MFSDYWVIAQLVAQFCSLVLLLGAVFFSGKIMLYWRPQEASELQLHLERQSYLVSSILQFALFFQVLSLLMFVNTANNHLPHIIQGAMCATGTLGVNEFGYRVLFLKAGAIFIYLIYLITNYLDNSEPSYPLTPGKYIWVFPAFVLVALDSWWLIQYFGQIEPSIIATCCSVSFTGAGLSDYYLLKGGKFTETGLYVFGGVFPILFIGQVGMYRYWKSALFSSAGIFWVSGQLLLGIVFVLSAIYTLKNYFVKYIYGLPSHTCLFDIFWAKYHYVGYVLFLSYYGLLGSLLFLILYQIYGKRLAHNPEKALKRVQLFAIICMLISFGLPLFYWFIWKGKL